MMSDIEKTIRERAIGLLARREHSRVELERKLTQKGFATQDVEPVLDWLEASDLQNDKRFVEAYVYARCRAGYGPLRIQLELRARGLGENLIDEQLSFSVEDWRPKLKALWQRRYLDRVLKPQEKAKALRFFLNRGFLSEWIYNVMDEVLEKKI